MNKPNYSGNIVANQTQKGTSIAVPLPKPAPKVAQDQDSGDDTKDTATIGLLKLENISPLASDFPPFEVEIVQARVPSGLKLTLKDTYELEKNEVIVKFGCATVGIAQIRIFNEGKWYWGVISKHYHYKNVSNKVGSPLCSFSFPGLKTTFFRCS